MELFFMMIGVGLIVFILIILYKYANEVEQTLMETARGFGGVFLEFVLTVSIILVIAYVISKLA